MMANTINRCCVITFGKRSQFYSNTLDSKDLSLVFSFSLSLSLSLSLIPFYDAWNKSRSVPYTIIESKRKKSIEIKTQKSKRESKEKGGLCKIWKVKRNKGKICWGPCKIWKVLILPLITNKLNNLWWLKLVKMN